MRLARSGPIEIPLFGGVNGKHGTQAIEEERPLQTLMAEALAEHLARCWKQHPELDKA